MPVKSAFKSVSEPVQGGLVADLAVVRYQIPARRKRAPVDVELHINPVSIGLGAVGAAATLWLLQMRPKWDTIDRIYGFWIWPSTGEKASKELHFDVHEGDADLEIRTIYKDYRGQPPFRKEYYVPTWTTTEFIVNPNPSGETEQEALTSIGHGPPFTTDELIRIKRASGVIGAGARGAAPGAGVWVDIVHPGYWLEVNETAQWSEKGASPTKYSMKVYGLERRKGFLESFTGSLF